MTTTELAALTPYERLCHWTVEREAVRLRREAGLPPPWTTDAVIGAFRFCNVRRADDRVTRWLVRHWYGPSRGHANTVAAAVLARQLNNQESLAAVGFPDVWDPAAVAGVLAARAAAGLRNFSAAYMITGTLGGTKIEQVVYKVVDPVARNPPAVDPSSMERTWAALVGRPGIQSFMAGQVVADLRLVVDGAWADRDDWAPVGPGSRRGMNRVMGRGTNDPLRQPQFLAELRTLAGRLHTDLPATVVGRLEAMDIQNCLCESDKYSRAVLGEGRPKQRFTPPRGRE